MRPQGFRSTLGNTLFAEGDVVANLTLFRPPDTKTFSAAEVRAFEALSRHMTRAMQMAIRLGRPENVPAATAAFEALPRPLAVLDRHRRVRYANARMEALLRRRAGLALRAGELVAAVDDAQPALGAYIDQATLGVRGATASADALVLRDAQGSLVALHAVPLGAAWPALAGCLVTVEDMALKRAMSAAELHSTFGCTSTEARLALLLAQGFELRAAAREMGITYETSRAYLKGVFGKTGVHSQAQLVALILSGERRTRLRR